MCVCVLYYNMHAPRLQDPINILGMEERTCLYAREDCYFLSYSGPKKELIPQGNITIALF